MGQRGPKPGSGGRPRKPLSDKILDGNPGKRPLTVIEFNDSAVDLEGQVMPKPSDYLSAKQKEGSTVAGLRKKGNTLFNSLFFDYSFSDPPKNFPQNR